MVIIANIASPKSIKNIDSNQKVCVSFVDILKQKGYKLMGIAHNITKSAAEFESKCEVLYSNLGGRNFPINSIVEITINDVEPTVAPSYLLFPETSEAQIIAQSLETYGVAMKRK